MIIFLFQSSKLFNEYRNSKDDTKHPKAAFETPYVVHLLVSFLTDF